MKNYIARQEAFGFTFYERERLRHKFFSKDELGLYLKEKSIREGEVEWLKLRCQNYRKDILCSPIRIYYELTLRCNLQCRYCFNNSGEPRSNELSTKEVLDSLDQLRKNNVIDIRFTGGEPTCRDDWYEILTYAKGLGFCISCNTNAAYLDPSINEKFAKLDIEQVTVSVDGCKKNHEYNRGKGSFDRTIKNLKIMYGLGVTLRINVLVNKHSMNDVAFMLDLVSKYADEINFFTVVFIGRGSHLEISDGVTVEDHLKMSKEIKRLKPKYPNLHILHFSEVFKRTSVNEDTGKKFGLKVGPPSGSTTLNITSGGGYCCGGYAPYIGDNMILGSCKTDNLFEIWQRNEKLEKIRDDGGRLIHFCANCPKFKLDECQGSKYETELNRLIHPEVKNPTCIYGDGPSLLRVAP